MRAEESISRSCRGGLLPGTRLAATFRCIAAGRRVGEPYQPGVSTSNSKWFHGACDWTGVLGMLEVPDSGYPPGTQTVVLRVAI